MPRLLRLAVLAVCLAALLPLAAPTASLAQSQTPDLVEARFAFSPELTYDAAIPAPADYLGYELGTRFTLHADMVAYLKALDAASDRITMHEYGRTHEDRPLYYLVVTTPANHARIDALRQDNLRLADPTDAGADALVETAPAVVWLSYNVHGNEASSTEAALQVAYRLAAATDAATTEWLSNAVVLLDPVINADGRDRYAYWYRSVQSRVLNTEANDLEHDEPWPGGRTNHYWFDLNRDWVWLVHPESQGRIAAYQRWLPQVHVDYHEQGFNANYFTMPGTTPRNLNLPDDYERWSDVFGRANVAAFDEHRISYATREAFDFFYPGYGSSYPSNMGAIGMLTEQGGHSRGGRAVETEDEYVLTLRQRIFDHYTTSLATIEAAAENRAGLLRYFRDAFSPSTSKSQTAAYLLPDDGGRGYAYDVVDMLLRHGVRVERAEAGFTMRDARSYWDGTAASRSFEAGTFIVPANQPRHTFVHTVLQRQMAIEDSVMYDMSTWSAPMAYNLRGAAWTTTAPAVRTTALAEAPTPPSGLTNADAQYAYVIDWRQRHAPKALAMLWDHGYHVRAAQKAFGDGTHDFSEGTLIVLLGRNRAKIDRAANDMALIAEAAGVEILGMDTGRMTTGIDLASRDSNPVTQPKVALLVDSPANSYTAGQLWFLFDQWTGLGIDRIRTGDLASLDLGEYDVLLLPGMGSSFRRTMDSTMVARLQAWVRAGGTLIGTENSALLLTKEQSGLTSVEVVKDEDEKDGGKDGDEDDAPAIEPSYYTTYAAREDSSGLRRIPGAAMQAHLDPTHPLAFGLGDQLFSLKFSDDALVPSENLHTVGYYAKDADAVLASGYASPANKRKLAGHAFAAVQPMGQGQVVFLVDNTQYRMFWVGPARLVQNAVMMVPGM